jgi:hypothetical protein
MSWLSQAEPPEKTKVVSDRCDISPIEALREEVPDFRTEVCRKRRVRKAQPRLVDYSTEKAPAPAWMNDRSLLPKKPPCG